MKICYLALLLIFVSGCSNRYPTQHRSHALKVNNYSKAIPGNLDSFENNKVTKKILEALDHFDKKYDLHIKIFSSKISPDASLLILKDLLKDKGYKYSFTSALSTTDKIEMHQSVLITEGCPVDSNAPNLGCITASNLEKMLVTSNHASIVTDSQLPYRAVKKLFSDKTKALKVEKIKK